jgi:alpha-L-fucosidase
MQRRTLIKGLATGLSSLYLSNIYARSLMASQPDRLMAEGPFKPTWDSLGQYQVPDWFRDAKFGIWAHWGPQC